MRAWPADAAALKAAGGIRTLAEVKALLEAGANRIGASSSVAIVRELARSSPAVAQGGSCCGAKNTRELLLCVCAARVLNDQSGRQTTPATICSGSVKAFTQTDGQEGLGGLSPS